MQTKQHPPSFIILCLIGIVALIALGVAVVLGYMVNSGHMPW